MTFQHLSPAANFSRHPRSQRNAGRSGFSLIEILVTIAIIGILVGMAIPAVMVGYRRAQQFRIEQEISQIEAALEQFKNKYGVYPPHRFNNVNEVIPYLNRIAPNHQELQIVTGTTRRIDIWWTNVGQRLNPQTSLAFWLSGLSKNKQYPLTYVNTSGNVQALPGYNFTPTDVVAGYSVEREVFHDLKALYKERTAINSPTEPIGTGAAPLFPGVAVVSQSDRYEPYVYFNVSNLPIPAPNNATTTLQTATNVPTQNVFLAEGVVTLGPYWFFNTALSTNVYQKKDSFQIMSPGLDGVFSAVTFSSGNMAGAGTNRFEKDNLTNFSNGRLENIVNN